MKPSGYFMTQGALRDGTEFAAKVLSSESEQGIKEFLAEIESISQVKHANLVRLLGCCIQRRNRILIYEYLENNSLDHALQGKRTTESFLHPTYKLEAVAHYLFVLITCACVSFRFGERGNDSELDCSVGYLRGHRQGAELPSRGARAEHRAPGHQG
jgi:serine/threonine protein kinase